MAVNGQTKLPGGLKKFQVMINDQDISKHVLAANIFQEIFSPTTTAIINILDSTNLTSSIPIKAGAKIKIDIQSEGGLSGDGQQTWEFVIYKIADKIADKPNALTYSIFAADQAFLINQSKRFYRAYVSQPTIDIVQNIVEESFGKTCQTHEADSIISMVMPGWTPFFCISNMLNMTTSSGAADYVFFQNADGNFSFKSFQKLYTSQEQNTGLVFSTKPANVRNKSSDTQIDYNLIIGEYHFEHFDALTNIQAGYYSSKTCTYDFITKEWNSKIFKFGQDNPDDKAVLNIEQDAINKYTGEQTNISVQVKHKNMWDNGPNYSDQAEIWIPSRKSALMKFQQQKLIFQIPGSAKACDWFAKSIDIDLPSENVMDLENKYDPQRRGRYLITHMAHMINKDTYNVNVQAVKKRLESL